MTGSERKQLGKGLVFVSPWLVGFLVFTLVPVVLSLYYSFCDFSIIERDAAGRTQAIWVGTDNYRQLFQDPEFYRTLKNTGIYAILSLPAGMMVSIGLALLLNAPIKGQAIYRTVIFLPSLVPVVASAMVWMWLFNARFGLLNQLLSKIGIEGPAWIGDSRWAMYALAMMSVWGVGNTVVIYLAGLQDIPRDLYEAAEIDGAGFIRRLFNVTLPMLSPVIFFNLIMALIGTLQVFALPFIMTGGGPERSTYMYTQYLYEKAFAYLQMGYASAMAWVQLLIILALTAFAFWTSKKWVHYQGK